MLVWIKCGIVVWVVVLLPYLASPTSPTPPTPTPPVEDDGMIRLPKTLRPTHYEVRLQAFLEGSFGIEGYVKVEVAALVNTHHIFLHMVDIITINETARVVDRGSGEEHRILHQRYNAVRSMYVVEVEEELLEGRNYSFSVSFVGTLGVRPRGFYRSKYTKENGEERWVAATQFQVIEARRAFPCMDEPLLKATFAVFLARREGMTALSNMPLRASTPMEGQDGWYWDEFERSVVMPTYLVAFAITDFPMRVVAGRDGSFTLIRVVTRAAMQKYTGLAGRIAPWILNYYTFYFSIPFSLPKIDIITLPENSFSAMENWGLITFRPHLGFIFTSEWLAWARASVGDQLEYGTRVAVLGLQVFEKYFGVAFPLPKTDLICPPEMSPNAMENWGLITFRESGLLYNPARSSASRKMWVCYLMAHELAHQWFGNLVTLAWWTDLWLNEGFATYLADVAVDQIEPTWGMLDIFVVSRLQTVMVYDALRTSQPISQPVRDPATINEIFNNISYLKGASITRMMNHFLTDATFRRALTDYLTTLQYGNAEQDDLWGFLTRAGHRDGTLPGNLTVKTIMDTWTLQRGFPVITVKRTANTTAVVKQEHFTLENPQTSPHTSPAHESSSSHDSSSSPQDSSDYSSLPSHDSPSASSSYDSSSSSSSLRWWVPLTYTSQEHPDFSDTSVKLWLSCKDPEGATTEIPYPEPGQWVVFNVKQTGYYRVNYDDENWALLTRQLEEDHTAIHVTNRAQIIDDAFNMAKAGRLSYRVALGLTGYLEKEREYVAWRAALDNLQHIYYMMNRDPAYGALKHYLLSLLLPVYRSLGGLEGGEGTVPDQLLSGELVWWVCRLDHPECVIPALALYRSWMANPEEIRSVSTNVRDAVSCTAVRKGGEEEWVFAWRRREDLKDALACTQEIWILNRYLDGAFNSSSGIRRQDAANTFRSVAREPLGALVAWNYLRAHWTRISEYIGASFFALPRMIEDVTRSFTTTLLLQELEEFERRHKPDGGLLTARGAVAQAVAATKVNVAWVQLHRQGIVDLLASRGFSSDLASLSE